MNHIVWTLEDARSFIEDRLAEFNITFEQYLESDLDDFEQAQVRDLWLLFHDLFVQKSVA